MVLNINHIVAKSTLLCGLYHSYSLFLGSSKYSGKFNTDSGIFNLKNHSYIVNLQRCWVAIY